MAVLELGTTGDGLLERDDALAVLGEAFADARLGHGSAVLIAGEAGAGKTVLTRSFCRAIGTRARVLVGSCDPLSTPRPLGPLRDFAATSSRLADLLELDAPVGDVFAALWAQLVDEPTVLVIEDTHWADEATLDLLRLLVRRIDMTSSLLIVTCRDNELSRGHPMRLLLGDLATSPSLIRLPLEPLSRGAVAALALGYEVDTDLLYRRTGGNPFFVTQVLASGTSDVPPSVRDLVLARTLTLTSTAVDLLDVVALSPPSAPVWLLDAALRASISAPLDECVGTGLVVADLDGLRFKHELARLAVDEAIGVTHRVTLQARILAALEARSAVEDIDVALLAHHAEEAQDAAAVLRYAPQAGRAAFRTCAYREAAAQFARALRFANGLSDGQRAELLEGRSRACYLADDQVEAIAVVREAVDCRHREGSPLYEARALIELVGYLDCRGHNSEAAQALERARLLAAGPPETLQHASVYELLARHLNYDGDPAGGRDAAAVAIELGDRLGDPVVAGHARLTVASSWTVTDFERGRAELDLVVRHAVTDHLHEVAARGLNVLGGRCYRAMRLDLADDYLDEAIEYCTDHTSDMWRINALAFAARVSLDRGDWDAAAEDLAEVLDDPRDSPWPHHEALLVLALIRARRGDPGAREVLDVASAVGVPAEEEFAYVDLAAARAEVAWLERRFDDLDEITTAAVEDGIAVDAGDIARLAFWRRLGELHVEMPDDAAGRYADGARCQWAVAAANFEQWGMPYDAALAHLEIGDETSLRRSHAAFQQLGAVPGSKLAAQRLRTLGYAGVERGPRPTTKANLAGLTSRELEVIDLLAEGLRNAEVADKLVISRKTVDHHVAAILRKLWDAHHRGEAVARATQLGLSKR